MWHACFKWGHANPFRLRVMWCCRRHHASPVPSPSTWREGTGSMGVLCVGGNRVWETHLYGHIGYFTWVIDLTSGASPLFWYLLLWRLLFIFVINSTSGASPSSWDFLYERFFVHNCMQRIYGILESGKIFKFRFLILCLFSSTHSNVFKLLSPGPFGFKCPDCRLSLGEVERTWSRGIVRGCFRIFFIRCFSFNLRYALNVQ